VALLLRLHSLKIHTVTNFAMEVNQSIILIIQRHIRSGGILYINNITPVSLWGRQKSLPSTSLLLLILTNSLRLPKGVISLFLLFTSEWTGLKKNLTAQRPIKLLSMQMLISLPKQKLTILVYKYLLTVKT
jgi:hypothetical protein